MPGPPLPLLNSRGSVSLLDRVHFHVAHPRSPPWLTDRCARRTRASAAGRGPAPQFAVSATPQSSRESA